MRLKLVLAALAATVGLIATAFAQTPRPIDKLSHILVIYLENRSFDNLFGEFPGANGIANAGEAAIQKNRAGEAYQKLPGIKWPFQSLRNTSDLYAVPSLDNLLNTPFAIDALPNGVTLRTYTRDLTHSFYANKAQINGGKNDRFVAYSNAGALTMGHYSQRSMKDTNLWKLASSNRLLDNFFQGAFGGSFLNHMWLACACVPKWADAPEKLRSKLNSDGSISDRKITLQEDGDFAVNTVQSAYLNDDDQENDLLPAQHQPTIGDRLGAKGVDWRWYSGGWNLAIMPKREHEDKWIFEAGNFQWHHQPFAYFQPFSPLQQEGRERRAKHLKDAVELVADIRSGQLPPVAFYKPVGVLNQHAGYANIADGDEEVGRIVKLMQESPMRDSYAIIITYDEYGGFFDHVPPPQPSNSGNRADFFGPGTRVPAILVSPFVQQGVDSTQFDTTSIAKFITERHRLDPLPGTRFETVESLSKAFDFSR
jgi:phospholipase C